ncbi:PQQ-dependent sugar dehydrogenase, partial [Streptomyces sp. DT225]
MVAVLAAGALLMAAGCGSQDGGGPAGASSPAHSPSGPAAQPPSPSPSVSRPPADQPPAKGSAT